MSEGVVEILQAITMRAINNNKRKPSYVRIGTIKALVDLGKGWHDYREVQRELCKLHKTGNIIIFELAKLYPQLIEQDRSERFRIKPEVFDIVAKHIEEYSSMILKFNIQNESY